MIRKLEDRNRAAMMRLNVDEACPHTTDGFLMDFPRTKNDSTPALSISNVELMCSVETLSTSLTKHGLLHTHPHLQNTERALERGKPGLVPGRDLFFTWLQLNYSRQLDWSLPLRTTLLAADLMPVARPCSTRTRTRTRTHTHMHTHRHTHTHTHTHTAHTHTH